MKKILYVADYTYLGGGEITLLNLISTLKKLSFEALLIIPNEGPILREAMDRSIDVRIVKMAKVNRRTIMHPIIFFKSIVQIIKIIKSEKVSRVFANSLNAGIYASIAARPFGIKTIWYCWGYDFPKDTFWQMAYRILFDKIIFCSHFVKEKMHINRFWGDNIVISYPGIELGRLQGDEAYYENLFKNEYGIPEGFKTFSIIGRLDPIKDHNMFLNVANEIARCYPKSYFIVAGGDNETDGGDSHVRAKLEERIHNMPALKGRVIFTGFVNDIKKIIKSSSIIFSCTGKMGCAESSGLVILEAMACGRPVIANAIGGPTEIIIDGFNGYLVEPGDYKSMAEKALFLINMESEYTRMANNAKRCAFEKYTMERFANDILNALYRRRNER